MTPRQKRIAAAKAKAVQYLLKHPTAKAGEVAQHSGVTWITAKRIIDRRQTPLAVLNDPLPRYDLPPAGVTLLNEALETFKMRGETYGDAASHWGDVAALWTIITGHPITPQQATSMMIGLKLLRLKKSPNHYDSLVDIAGYSAVKANVRAVHGG